MSKIKNVGNHVLLFIWYRIIGSFFRLLPIKKNKIVFMNFFGKGYGDNPKYIADSLIEDTDNSLELVWLIKRGNTYDFPKQIIAIHRGTWKELYHLATAKIWVDNSRKHFGVKKRKEQFYMQTWHASIGFKQIEKDIQPDFWYTCSAKNDSKMIDILLSGSRWQTEYMKKVFWYNGNILECGIPKNDFWSLALKNQNEIKNKVCEQLGLDKNKKFVLYAPTFRGKNSIKAYDIEYHHLLEVLENNWSGEWNVLIRLHPNIEKESKEIQYSKNVINASQYSDINELMILADLLITDYSSCLFDAVYIGKPSLLYASDIEEYSKQRGFAIPLSEAPTLIAKNNAELENVLKEFQLKTYLMECEKFLEKYGIVRVNNASKCATQWILERVG